MNLQAIFSLIVTALALLLPVFLLIGRARSRREAGENGQSPLPGARADLDAVPETAVPAPRSAGEPAPIVDRLILQRGAPQAGRATTAPATSGLRPAAPGLRPVASGLRPAASGLRPAASGPAQGASRPAVTTVESRLARLTPLQRAVVYSEILGPPVAERQTSGR